MQVNVSPLHDAVIKELKGILWIAKRSHMVLGLLIRPLSALSFINLNPFLGIHIESNQFYRLKMTSRINDENDGKRLRNSQQTHTHKASGINQELRYCPSLPSPAERDPRHESQIAQSSRQSGKQELGGFRLLDDVTLHI